MKRVLIAAASLLATSIFSANAADMQIPVKAPPPIAVPLFTWTGFYIGLNAGLGGDKYKYPFGIPTFASGELSLTSVGGFGGGQIGYNYQMGNWVIGFEGDAQAAAIKGEVAANVAAGGGSLSLSAGSKIDFFATARGRIGYAWDRVLFYATGGYAYAHSDSYVNISGVGIGLGGFAGGSTKNDHNGWVVGGGVEYAMTNHVTFKTEYQYLSFEEKNASTLAVLGAPLGSFLNVTPTVHTVRAGINYKF